MLLQSAIDWEQALRSDKYPQATNVLRRDAGYCCFGVLEDVNGAHWIKTTNGLYGIDSCEGALAFPRPETCSTVQLQTKEGLLPFENRLGKVVSLIGMNDSGFTFSQIADMIHCFSEVL